MSHVAVAVPFDSVSYLASPAEHRLDRVRCQKEALLRLAIREGFTVVSLRAQEKTPRSRILLPWGLSGMKPTLFEKETETFRKRNIHSGPEGEVPVPSPGPDGAEDS